MTATNSDSNTESCKYWAFISYSHADEKWAAWLHCQLEMHRVPRELVGKATPAGIVPARLFPVFRDREELAGASELGPVIEDALRQSRSLIVICSPRSAHSRWVTEEIRYFKQLGRRDRVFALIVDGEPGASRSEATMTMECFPAALRFRVDADGRVTDVPAEPIAADVRPGKDGRDNAVMKLVAGVLSVGFDELRRRELQRLRRQRGRWQIAACVWCLIAVILYIGLADTGVGVFGGNAIRTLLDRQQISVFRPIPREVEIAQAASDLRPFLFSRLQKEREDPLEWANSSPTRKVGPKESLAVWVACQGITSALGCPEANIEELRPFFRDIDRAFSNGYPVEFRGVKYGWQMSTSDAPQAEPVLWTLLALVNALKIPGLLSEQESQLVRERLAYAQEVCEQFGPQFDGAWNIYARQVNLDQHCTYTATLALWTLLELRSAELAWRGSIEQRDDDLRATATWLAAAFDAESDVPGWTLSSVPKEGFVLDGLTLQVYATLLRAEAEAGIEVPSPILDACARHLNRVFKRPLDYPDSRGSFLRALYDFPASPEAPDFTDDLRKMENMSIGFAWHPCAIETAAQWLARQRRLNAPIEERVQTQRILGWLVIDLGQEVRKRFSNPKAQVWVSAETLLYLSRVGEKR